MGGAYGEVNCPMVGTNSLHFADKERDTESGLDDFGARSYNSNLGRFISPDPLNASATLENPQSWNRYAYALNNPIRITDPEGLYPSPYYNCNESHPSCLNNEQRRILENSTIDGKSGEELWNAIGQTRDQKGTLIGESLQNSFVNQTDGLSAIKFGDGKSAISFVNSIADIKEDRIIANVEVGLADEISKDSRFATAPAGDHAPYNSISYKSTDYPQGNIQFSFNSSHNGLDLDHDLFKPGVTHVFAEYLYNHVTNSRTSQDSVRKMLMRNPRVGLTPSPDPKWNR